MNRRDLLAHASAALGLFVLSGCASSRRSRLTAGSSADQPLGGLPQSHAPHVTRQSRRPDWLDDITPTQNPAVANVIPRSAWTSATPIASRADAMQAINKITVHHDGMSPFYATSQGDAMRRLESIRKAHVAQGWADIGYHFSIDPAGRIYACRTLSLQGAHVKNQNAGNIGVMVMGNFEEQSPTPAAVASLEAFVSALMRQYRIGTPRLYTHRELASTACPGKNLQVRMVQARKPGGALAIA